MKQMPLYKAKSLDIESELASYTASIKVSSSALKQNLTPYPFQVEMITNMLHAFKDSRHLYNASQMGTGKTCISATVANSIPAHNVLVICPASLRLNWLRELLTWYEVSNNYKVILSGDDVHSLTKHTFGTKLHPSPIITSYSMLLDSRLFNYLRDRTFDLIIIDEYHYAKNIKAKRTKRVLRLQHENAKRSIMLSGTPLTNSALDLFPALHIISKHNTNFSEDEMELCGDFTSFANKFCNVTRGYQNRIEFKGVKNHEELKELVRCPRKNFFFRKTIDEVLPDLPPKIYTRVDLDLDFTKEMLEYLPIANRLADEFEASPNANPTEVVNKYFAKDKSLMHFRHLLGVLKATSSELHSFIQNFLDQNQAVVVGAYHKKVVEVLSSKFKDHNPIIYTGSTSPTDKDLAVTNFQAGKSKLFIGNILAAGTGITLTVASNVIMVEYDWLPNNNEQFIARCRRIGQKSLVNVYFPITNTQFEKKLVGAMIKKAKDIDKVMT